MSVPVAIQDGTRMPRYCFTICLHHDQGEEETFTGGRLHRADTGEPLL